jgi:SAM-dependent methyltransferase
MHQQSELHTMNPHDRFSGRADAYAKYRPSYPPEAINFILKGLKSPDMLLIADIGAGTGIAARLLAGQGARVVAIEPNSAMLAAAEPHPQVEFRQGSAEQTGLADSSVDLVTTFQAFHWFDPQQTLPEFARILKPNGRLAVVWNNRDRQDPFTAAYSELLRTASNQHPAQTVKQLTADIFDQSAFRLSQYQSFRHSPCLDLASLLGRTDSLSYIPEAGQVRDRLNQSLHELYQQFCDQQGLVYLAHTTDVYLACLTG